LYSIPDDQFDLITLKKESYKNTTS